MTIIFYIFLVLCISFIALGLYIFLKYDTKFIIRFKRKSIQEEKVICYTRYVGIGYIIAGSSVIPLILTGITGNDKFEYLSKMFWFLCFISLQIMGRESKKKFGFGILL